MGLEMVIVVLVMVVLLSALTVLPGYLRKRRAGWGEDNASSSNLDKSVRQQDVRTWDAVDHGDFTGKHDM